MTCKDTCWNLICSSVRQETVQATCKVDFICALFWKGLHISLIFLLSVLNCCHLSETSQVHCTGRLHRHAPLLSPHTDECRCVHALTQIPLRTHIAIRPSALLLSAIVLNHNPADPLWQSSQRLRDNINSNPPSFLPPLHLFTFLALSLSLPLPYPCGSVPILSLSNTEAQKIPRISIHTP